MSISLAGATRAATRAAPGDRPPGSRLRIIVLGYIVRGPLGGLVWHHLQYVLGLARLGHDVYFVEDSDDYPACYDPTDNSLGMDPSYGLRFAARVFEHFGLGERWAYHDAHAARWTGPAAGRIRAVCASADLLLNLSAVNPLRPWAMTVPVRALVDTDPVFTQIRHLTDLAAHEQAARHTCFFSFGENVAAPDGEIPDDGFHWQPTRQPVVLDAWSVTPGPADGTWTTVMQWDSYGVREHCGRRFGMKSDSFAPYWDLPARTGARFELALGSASAPRERLRAHGWHLRDPLEVTRDPWSYQRFIAASRGEWSVAKHGYVEARSGWFSERSAAYLASGRPVVVQDTGFSRWFPVGEGVHAFSDPDGAATALDVLRSRYPRECKAARALASEYFEAGKVLSDLLDRAIYSQQPAA